MPKRNGPRAENRSFVSPTIEMSLSFSANLQMDIFGPLHKYVEPDLLAKSVAFSSTDDHINGIHGWITK